MNFIPALYNLEHDWRDLVHNSDQLSEKHQQQQTALWELAQTEVAYIKTLKVVTDVSNLINRIAIFIQFMKNLKNPVCKYIGNTILIKSRVPITNLARIFM